MSELKIPEDLQEMWAKPIHDWWTPTVGKELIERIARLEAENAALKAQVQRLSAQVSDDEWHYLRIRE